MKAQIGWSHHITEMMGSYPFIILSPWNMDDTPSHHHTHWIATFLICCPTSSHQVDQDAGSANQLSWEYPMVCISMSCSHFGYCVYIYSYINTLINSVTPDTREKCRIIRLLLGPTRRVFSESTTSTMSNRSTNVNDMLVKQCRKPSIWVDGWYQPQEC